MKADVRPGSFGTRAWSVICILVVILITASILIPSTTQAQEEEDTEELPVPIMRAFFNKNEYHISVEPGSNKLVSIGATFYCDLPPEANGSVYFKVTLRPSAEGLYISQPPAMIFSRSTAKRTFSISVMAPEELEHKTRIPLILDFQWEYESTGQRGTFDPISCDIVVDQYCRLSIEREPVTARTPVGEWLDATLYVLNEGNGRDRIYLEAYPRSSGVDVAIDREYLDLDINERGEFHLKVRQRSGEPRITNVRITARSNVEGQENETHYVMPFNTRSSLKSFTSTPSQYLPVISISILVLLVVAWAVLRSKLFPDEEEKKASEPERDLGPGPKPFKREKRPPKGLYKQTRNKRS